MTQRTRVTLEAAVIRAALAHADRMDGEGLGHVFDDNPWSPGLGRYLNESEKALLEACRALTAHLPAEVADTPGRWVEGSPETSQHAALTVVRGKLGRQVLGHIRNAHWHGAIGSTDDAMEATLKQSHQSLSSARNALCNAGWLTDSGLRRETRSGRPAAVWTLTEAAIKKLEEEA